MNRHFQSLNYFINQLFLSFLFFIMPAITVISPLFISKLINMLKSSNETVIRWNSEGNGFTILDIKRFIDTVMPQYFKTQKFSSLVRQLNHYGFHKRRLNNTNTNQVEFVHPYISKQLSKDVISSETTISTSQHTMDELSEACRLSQENKYLRNMIKERETQYNELMRQYYSLLDYQNNQSQQSLYNQNLIQLSQLTPLSPLPLSQFN